MHRNLRIVIFLILVVLAVGFSPIVMRSASKKTPDMSAPIGKTTEIRSAEQLEDQTDTQQIRITVDIPRPPATMSLYKLTASRAPVDFLNEKLEKAKLPTLRLDKKNYVVRSGPDN